MRRLAIIAGSCAALGLLVPALWRLSDSRTFQLFGEIVPRVETTARVVALTFDDGPTPEATTRLLSVLRQRGVRATFFVTGEALGQHPELGERIAREGHELGNHSFSHRRMIFKRPAFIRAEIEGTDRLIRQAGFRSPIHFRPPYGKKLVLLPYFLSRTGRKCIMWDVEPDSDPRRARSADEIVSHVVSKVRPGSIVLLHVMHERGAPSLQAVPGIIDGLKRRGYRFGTVSELLAER